jgi:hypothetical protein
LPLYHCEKDIQAGWRASLVTVSLGTGCNVCDTPKAKESEVQVLSPFRLSGPSTRSRQLAKVPLNERGIKVDENEDEFGTEHGFLEGLQHRITGVRMKSMVSHSSRVAT